MGFQSLKTGEANSSPGLFAANRLIFLLFLADLMFIVFAVLNGLPLEIAGKTIKMKHLKAPVTALILLYLAGLATHPSGWKHSFKKAAADFTAFCEKARAPWILAGAAAILFTWQQVTEYLALEINFLPFSFYDYMLYYFFQGKINYTGLLHTYYHANNILYLFAPLWKLAPSPLWLVGLYGPLAALAAVPLFYLGKEKTGSSAAAFLLTLAYLNYRYLQNVLQMNFSIEIFYPLFIFAGAYFALRGRWGFFYPALLLGLSVKEDSFLYFGALGLWIFFLPRARAHGVVTMALSAAYFYFVTHVFMPMTGNTVLQEDLNNFVPKGEEAGSLAQVALGLLANPAKLFGAFFNDPEKIKTYVNLFSRLAFVPLLTPAVLLVAVPVFPLFMHSTGDSVNFYNLRFHYGAAVIPFVFLALVCGYANLSAWAKGRGKLETAVRWALPLLILLLNAGHYRTERFTGEDVKSIRWVQNIPAGKNLVTHGHLLPYAGYRKLNYYLADPFELGYHPAHKPYTEADFYLFDRNVNPYPWDWAKLDTVIKALEENPDYSLVLEDPNRKIFKRKAPAHAGS